MKIFIKDLSAANKKKKKKNMYKKRKSAIKL